MRHNPTQGRNFMRTVSKGHNFMTGLELDEFDNASVCREYTHPRDHPAAYTEGSIGVTPDLDQPWKLLRPKCTACTGSRSTFVPSRRCCGMDCFPVPEVFLRRRQSMETAGILWSTISRKDPNQKFRHPKPTRRHFDQWHFRSWWNLLRVFNIMVNSVFLSTISVIDLTSLLSCRSDGRRKTNMERRKICVIAQSRPTRNLVACDSQPVLSIWRLQVPLWEAWGLQEKVAQVRVREAQEDLLQRFRARATRQCLKIQTRIEAQGDLWQDLTSKPPAKKWAYHNLRQETECLWKGFAWTCAQKIVCLGKTRWTRFYPMYSYLLHSFLCCLCLQPVQLHISKCGHTTFGWSGMKMKKVCVCVCFALCSGCSGSRKSK